MTASKEWMELVGNTALAFGNIRVIACLLDDPVTPLTDPAIILAGEAIQTAGGYQSQAFTTSTMTWNNELGYAVADQSGQFIEAPAGAGWQLNFVAAWQGRGANSNKPCTVDPITDRANVPLHGCVNGDFGFVVGATQPTGMLIKRYYLGVVDANYLEFFNDQARTDKVDIQDIGVGSLRFIYANGRLANSSNELALTTVSAGQPYPFFARFRSLG
ncbi:MAG TPA: hypothetical protein V6D10_07055 [Trichocoleus sp.]